jgi:modulator of FtsH protease
VGLLFVAIQINRDRIIKHPTLPGRALETLFIFLLPLIASVLLVIPGQPVRLLGAELLILAVAHGVALALVAVGRAKRPMTPLERSLRTFTPGFSTTLLTLISGGLLLSGRVSGLYWLVAAFVVAILGGVATAWIFLMSDSEAGPVR